MERRGRIPVAKFRTQEGKTRSRSRVREPDYNEQDPETDLFTLLEDNIALKEENKSLQAEIVENKKSQTTLIEENAKLRHEMDSFKIRQKECEMELKDISGKLAKAISERSVLDKLRRTKINELKNSLTNQMQSKHDKLSSSIIIDSNGLKSKILKVIPALVADNDEMESLIGLDSALAVTSEAASHCITNECIERLLDEFVLLKNTLSTVELQLYEANEKISELMENQHSQEEENENLRSENNNLTRVAQLLTENMKESVETSRKMEAALMKLKERNDDLTMKTRDIIDGQRATPDGDIDSELKCAENSEKIRRDVHNQNKDHGERIVEMKSLLDTTIEKTTNDELKVLQLKMEILEEELRQAVARAVRAENELENLKCFQSSQEIEIVSPSLISQRRTPPLPPPPPPPIPAVLLYSPFHNKVKPNDGKADPISDATITATTTFNESIVSHNLRSGSSHCGKQQVETATGLDALVRELKSGKVTLRRHRRKTRTSEALQEMFQVLEISQKQNRNSKICIEINS